METYMGVDLSLSATGLVVLKHNVLALKTTIKSTNDVGEGERLLLIANSVLEAANIYQPDEVAFEAPFSAHNPKFINASMAIAELHGAIKLAFASGGRQRPFYVAASTLKKFVTGNGRAEKSDMKMAILKKWGLEFKDNNQSDAYGLARIAGALHGGWPADLDYEQECINGLRKSPLNEERWEPAAK